MIESIKSLAIIYTDHDVSLKIFRQTSFIISFINKLNLRTVKSLKYVRRFDLIIRYKFENFYFVSNTLSRLSNATNHVSKKVNNDELDVYFVAFMTKINSEFRERLLHDYILNSN